MLLSEYTVYLGTWTLYGRFYIRCGASATDFDHKPECEVLMRALAKSWYLTVSGCGQLPVLGLRVCQHPSAGCLVGYSSCWGLVEFGVQVGRKDAQSCKRPNWEYVGLIAYQNNTGSS